MTLRRRAEEWFFRGVMLVCVGIVLASAAAILYVIARRGIPVLSLKMLTTLPGATYGEGGGGGILNALLGSLYMAGAATAVATLAGFAVAVYLQVYAGKTLFASAVRLLLDVLWGVPSIIYGVFAFTIMLMFGVAASLLGGIIALVLLEFPIVVRAMEEALRAVPEDLIEATHALGATRLETALRVMRRQAMPGLLAGVLLAFGRGIGDAASVLFSAGYSDYVPSSLMKPAASLPLAIFFQLGMPFPEVRERAFGAAAALTGIVLAVSILSRAVTRRWTRP